MANETQTPMPDMFALCQQIGVMSAKLDKIDTLEKQLVILSKITTVKLPNLNAGLALWKPNLPNSGEKTGS